MAQNLNLSFTGLYNALSDFNGGPPGACTVANNIESRYKNTAEPRRGFNDVLDSNLPGVTFDRLINFQVGGPNRTIAKTSAGEIDYYDINNLPNPWTIVPGDFSSGLYNPDDSNAKCRFSRSGSNLYCTSGDGLRSLASGSNSTMLRAGVPKALNLAGVATGSSGFLTNNTILDTTGDVANGLDELTNLADTTGIAVGQYISGTAIPAGTTVQSITPAAPISIQTGTTSAGSPNITAVGSLTGIVAGILVTGTGIPDGAKVVSASVTTVVLDKNAYRSGTGVEITYTTPLVVVMSANATGSHTAETISFYNGARVAYRILYGRIEIGINGQQTTRLGTASTIAYVENSGATDVNVALTATLPKNSEGLISFYQLYRSDATAGITLAGIAQYPLDQYQLVAESTLTHSDFVARTISITDSLPNSSRGLALYSGTDQEGPTQENSAPPMAWDICTFRDFAIYGNITRLSSLNVTIEAVGATAGIQVGDTLTIAGLFAGDPFTETYTAASSESAAARQFQVFSTGTPSQNIADTADSLIRVINYDNSLPVHCLLLSSATNQAGQILFEADNPSTEQFSIVASAHGSTAYDPSLAGGGADSLVNTIQNGIAVSKVGELEAVPLTNLLPAGSANTVIYRVIALRDYVFVIASDGVYKLQGLSPDSLVISSFDLTVKIIGADTAVRLNSSVWMMSNQGVVVMNDTGANNKSFPIDDLLNVLVNSFRDSLNDVSFGISYESDRKYFLCVPNGDQVFSSIQYCYNYQTSCWTTWSRNIRAGFVSSSDNKLYISRADVDSDENGLSVERKAGTFRDYVDESFDVTIVSSSTDQVVLLDITGVSIGDVLFQSDTVFSPILDINLLTNTLTVSTTLSWIPGAAEILSAYDCDITWKPVFGDNPAFVRQYSEGLALFKHTNFSIATLYFSTDFSPSSVSTEIDGQGVGSNLWGLFQWGRVPWGGNTSPSNIRFLIPQSKQFGSLIIPSMNIRSGYSNFIFQGLSISYSNVSMEVSP